MMYAVIISSPAVSDSGRMARQANDGAFVLTVSCVTVHADDPMSVWK